MNYLQGQKFRELKDDEKIYYCDTHNVNSFFDNIQNRFLKTTLNGIEKDL